MIFTDQATRKKRLDLCEGCEYFNKQTSSCGTFLPKKMLQGEFIGDEVEHKGRKVRLCGCDMRQKVKFKTARCPINKWHSTVKKADVQRLKDMLDAFEGKRQIPMEQAREVVDAYNELFDAKRKVKSCGGCFRDLVTEIKEAVNQYE